MVKTRLPLSVTGWVLDYMDDSATSLFLCVVLGAIKMVLEVC